ncbi:MAG TPA: S9 family peptidase [Methylomirabilota bacterium]|nr:S9 family peptidase [Methylomirabilota bacterium]
MNKLLVRSAQFTFLLVAAGVAGTLFADDNSAPPPPPVAKKVPRITEIHGQKLVDNYFWLRDKPNPEVRAYLEAENAYTDAVMKPTEALQQKLFEEIVSHIKETDVNVPYRQGGFFYYSRWEKGRQYPIYARKKGTLDAPEQITLDQNQLAAGQKFLTVAAYNISDDGNSLAYSTDNTGFRQYKLFVRDLRTGRDSPLIAERVGSVAWANDNQTLFYTVEDAQTKRQCRLFRHKLEAASGPDALIFEEPDQRFEIAVHKTRSGSYLLLEIASRTTSETRYLPADKPLAAWKIIEPRRQDVEYYAGHHGDFFYIRTNDAGRNFRLIAAPVAAPAKENWKEVVPLRPEVMLEDFDEFQDFYVLAEREGGWPQLTVVNFAGGPGTRIAFPEPVYSAFPQINREYKTSLFRYSYQSLVTPASVYDYDVEKNSSTLLKQTEVPGGYDASKYASERVWAAAKDGVKVPVSVIYRKDLKKADGSNPLYVYGYGSYGANTNDTFSPARISLLDRGVVMAYAHIRGGGELGKAWHDDGRMMNKLNTFLDFIACTEHLVTAKYGARGRIVIEGGSAGGLLMGAVANMRPDLFNVVISHVPFVDVINTMLDETLPLTVPEFEEWGNPKEKPAFDYMIQYSPYDNIEAKSYPVILVKTSFNDSQVMYWEPAKYVAKMRALRADRNLLLLKTNMGAGHGGSSGRYDRFREVAFDYAFLLTQLGINN